MDAVDRAVAERIETRARQLAEAQADRARRQEAREHGLRARKDVKLSRQQ